MVSGAQVNYARQALRHADAAHAAGQPAIISRNERGEHRELSWPELRRQVAALALHLRAQGVGPGDRVAAYLPNIPEAMVALLATASLGAIWSVCAPDMGTAAVLDRFRQIEPKALIAVDGVTYGGRDLDRRGVLAELRAALPTLEHVVVVDQLGTAGTIAGCVEYTQATARDDAGVASFEPLWLPFDHPLWIVYSSGTTGLPKPIVHGHGGMVLVALLLKGLHNDIGPSHVPNSFGERYHWYSSTGWVMWNAQASGLLSGTTCVIYDGNPGGSRERPDWGTLWRFAAETGVTFFGAGAAFYANCMKAGIDLAACGDLPASARWAPRARRSRRRCRSGARRNSRASRPEPGMLPAASRSGGTTSPAARISAAPSSAATASCPRCPAKCSAACWARRWSPGTRRAGPSPARWASWSARSPFPPCRSTSGAMPPRGRRHCRATRRGRAISRAISTCTRPATAAGPAAATAPASMGAVWRHGDWLRVGPEGRCVIYGRSDATINRHGLRMGTSELYRAVEALPEVLDSLVVDLEYLGRESHMPLFVALREGAALDDALRERIAAAIRTALSPRFVPDEIVQVAEVPRTLTGKKQELPIKKLLLGQPLEKVVNRDAMANPGCLGWYEDFARRHLARTAAVAGAPGA